MDGGRRSDDLRPDQSGLKDGAVAVRLHAVRHGIVQVVRSGQSRDGIFPSAPKVKLNGQAVLVKGHGASPIS